MKKPNVFVVPGAAGLHDASWAYWLKAELEKLEYKVYLLDLPVRLGATPQNCDAIIDKYKFFVDKDSIFIGHSRGCHIIVNYIAKHNLEIRAAILVAGPGGESYNDDLTQERISYLNALLEPFARVPRAKQK